MIRKRIKILFSTKQILDGSEEESAPSSRCYITVTAVPSLRACQECIKVKILNLMIFILSEIIVAEQWNLEKTFMTDRRCTIRDVNIKNSIICSRKAFLLLRQAWVFILNLLFVYPSNLLFSDLVNKHANSVLVHVLGMHLDIVSLEKLIFECKCESLCFRLPTTTKRTRWRRPGTLASDYLALNTEWRFTLILTW